MTLSFRLLIFLLITAPLAFGTVESWSLTLLEGVALGATLCLLLHRAFHKNSTCYLPPGMVFLLLLLAYFLLQLVPLPVTVVKYLSPAAYELASSTVGKLHEISMLPLSVNRQATLAEFFRFASYAGVYFLTVQLLTRRRVLKTTVKMVVIFGSLIALEAILQKATAGRLIYWFRSVPLNAIQPMGPYVYHNHFAGLMEMLCPLAVGLFFAVRPRLAAEQALRKKVVDFLSNPALNTHMLAGTGAVIIAVAIFLSLSRGGMLSLGGALLVLAFLLNKFTGSGQNKLSLLLIPALITIVVGWFGWSMIFERFYEAYVPEGGGIQDARLEVWQDTLAIIKDYWLTGSGLGTFLDTYPLYRTVAGISIFDHAHNDYLELLSTTGVIGFTLVGLFLAKVIRHSWVRLRQRSDTYSICMTCASLAGIIALMLHSLTDFNFYLAAANGLYFFFLCGLLVSTAHTSLKAGGRRSLLPVARRPVLYNAGIAFTGLVLVVSLLFNAGGIKANRIFAAIKTIDLATAGTAKLDELAAQAEKMIHSAPWEAKYHFTAGNIAYYAKNRQQAYLNYLRAVMLNPAKSDYVQRLGIVADLTGKESGQELILRGTSLAPRDFISYKQTALWLFYKKRHSEAADAMHLAMVEDAGKVRECIEIMKRYGMTPLEMQRAIPAEVGPQLTFAAYLREKGLPANAELAYGVAEKLVFSDPEVSPWHFTSLYWYFLSQKNYQKALAIILRGVESFPEEASLQVQLGDLHRKMENFEAAKEVYRQAISLAANSVDARLHLGAIIDMEQGYEAAVGYYDDATELLFYSKNAQPAQFIALVDFYLKYDKLSRVSAIAQRGTEMFPDSLYLQVRLGGVYRKMDKRIRAEEAYLKAWKLIDQGGVEVRDWMLREVAEHFSKKGGDDKTQKLLTKGLALYPDDIPLLTMQGNLFIRSGDDQAALEIFQQVLKIAPANKTAVRMINKLSAN